MTAGVDTASATQRYKMALYLAAQTVFAADDATVVSFGIPGPVQADDLVAFLGSRSRQDPATLGTNRAREEILTQDVVISSYRGGGWEAEITASDRAYDLLRRLEVYVRVDNTELRGLVDPLDDGVVRWCFLAEHESEGMTDPEDIELGRSITITATFEARVRIKTVS